MHSDDKAKISFLQSRSFCNNTNTWQGFGGGCMSFRDLKRSQFHVTSGLLIARTISTTNGDGNGEENIGCMADLAEKTMEVASSQAAAVSHEVAVAAADSWPPVAFLQYVIDGIHTYTGLNWWASIVITTVVIRTLLIPLMIRTSKYMILMDQETEYPEDLRMERLYKERGVSPLTPFKEFFIQGSVLVTFYLAIQNMVEKVPSFQTGGMSWFIDLTTTDSSYILPCLIPFSLWVRRWLLLLEVASLKSVVSVYPPFSVEGFNSVDMVLTGLTHQPGNLLGVWAALTKYFVVLLILPPVTGLFAASLPNAFLCYWITFNFFSYVYKRIMMKASVKKFLKIESPEEVLIREAIEREDKRKRNKEDVSDY